MWNEKVIARWPACNKCLENGNYYCLQCFTFSKPDWLQGDRYLLLSVSMNCFLGGVSELEGRDVMQPPGAFFLKPEERVSWHSPGSLTGLYGSPPPCQWCHLWWVASSPGASVFFLQGGVQSKLDLVGLWGRFKGLSLGLVHTRPSIKVESEELTWHTEAWGKSKETLSHPRWEKQIVCLGSVFFLESYLSWEIK